MKTFSEYLAEQNQNQLVCPLCKKPMAPGTNFCPFCNQEVTPRPRIAGDGMTDKEKFDDNIPWDAAPPAKLNTTWKPRPMPKRFPPRQ